MKNDISTIDSLSKSYKDNQVLNNINLHIKAGTVYGFLGPNGAGKSTTIRIILGLIKKYTGDIKVFDYDLKKHKVEILY
ncbi:ATP-binding cassette domain-containing protein [Clostridium estertheticum]|uniref:ATP-binding cassette domain-containing protein n=1 Tax=Clostridium estertheticum TaxID=238834 RepID=UPI001CF11F04|nr:ATP-binding cassette domain-containing protein [Clostridium estertheticum]MCB2308447.1 ATP-binding cassette domain-containing protein [Clostridium estertheticum]MCB2347212.1 ATP-binding cassette domain-containing protein [Clostridium estertheticum]MCB2350772.1 ATP-binding cassette domain-containing protein [Clostridium estertheticum]WAG44774.1 ATP-binding cassette domain-containing protein [Clostridium estertheticum]